MPIRFHLVLAALLSCFPIAYGAEGGVEVWYFQKSQDLAKIEPPDAHPSDQPGDVEVTRRTDHWKIDGLKLDARALHIGTIEANVTAKVRVKKRVVVNLIVTHEDRTVVIADMDVNGSLRLKQPVDIAMPETIELQCVQKGGQARLELTESGRNQLRDHFTRALNDFLSEANFDRNFSHDFTGVNDIGKAGFNIWFDHNKGNMLAQVRAHLGAEMAKPGYFEQFLRDISRTFPIPVSHTDQTITLVMDRRDITIDRGGQKVRVPLPTDTWAVREKDAPMRFQPATLLDIPRLPIQRPSATAAVHAVRLSHLVAEYFAHAGDNADLSKLALSADHDTLIYRPQALERAEIAKWIASVDAPTDANASRVLGLEISGDHAPVVQPWYVPARNGAPAQYFFDLWISARWIDSAAPGAPQPRLGFLMVFSLAQNGQLKLVQLSPYKPGNRVGPTIPLSDDRSFGKALGVKMETLLLQSLLNARLDAFNPEIGVKGLAGIRMLGTRGNRASGEFLAEALAIDLTVQP